MNTLVRERRFALLLFVCIFVVSGCTKTVSMIPVSGKVTVGDQVVTAGQVALLRPDSAGRMSGKSNLSAGSIDSNGTYTIFTDGKPGAPAGKYKVVVTPSMVPTGGTEAPKTAFNPKYQDSNKTDLEIEVVPNAPAGKYDLKLSK